MYNESQKKRFIVQYTGSPSTFKACVSVFNSLEPYEMGWGADLCTQDSETLSQAINETITGLRHRSILSIMSILKEYVRWCLNSNIKGACDGMLKVNNIDGINIIKERTVRSPAGLQVYLDSICDPEGDETIDNIYRCYFWLAYCGVKESDAFLISSSDIDLENLSIRYNGLNLVMYREALQAFKNCVKLKSFVYKNSAYKSPISLNRVSGNSILRGVKGENSEKTMRVAISRRSKKCIDGGKTKLKLSYGRVLLSGIFYRAYLDEETFGKEPQFIEFARESVEEEYRSRGITDVPKDVIRAKQVKANREYLNDYKRWKLANMM